MSSLFGKKEVISFLVSNYREKGNPIGVDSKKLTEWANDVNLASSSETVLYTGMLYQLMPWAEEYTNMIMKAENQSVASSAIKLASRFDVTRRLGRALLGAKREEIIRCNSILRNASLLLSGSGIEHAYLGEEEPYSGAIFFDLGLGEEVGKAAERVKDAFESRGVRRVITVDPHSTFMFREVYPRFVNGFNSEVKHYLEVVRPKRSERKGGDYVLHDPCLLARDLNLSEELRSFIEAAGLSYVEPERSGRSTFCCGGPVESIAPKLAYGISCFRSQELAKKSTSCIVSCPVCLSNLGRCTRQTGLKVFDILEVI